MFLLGGNKRGNKILKHTHFDIKRYKKNAHTHFKKIKKTSLIKNFKL